MQGKYYRKDWILFYEVANEGGRVPENLIPLNPKDGDSKVNKHIPFIIEKEDGYLVKMGQNGYHVTDAEHHAIFIDLFVDEKYHYRQYFKLHDEPKAFFQVPKGQKIVAVSFCNLHGIWKNELK